jgi:hypothetical protein
LIPKNNLSFLPLVCPRIAYVAIISLLLFSIITLYVFQQEQQQQQALAQKEDITQKIIAVGATTEGNDFSIYTNPTYDVTMMYPSQWIEEIIADAGKEQVSSSTTDSSLSSLLQIPNNNSATSKPEPQNLNNNYNGNLSFLISFHPPRREYGDIVSVDLVIKNLTAKNMSLNEYAHREIKFLEEANTAAATPTGSSSIRTILETKPIFIAEGNIPAYKVVYIEKIYGIQLKTMEVWTIKGDKAYHLAYTTDEFAYDSYLPTAQKMIDSFRVTTSQ